MSEFVHLRVHSDYSLSEGASKVADLVSAAKKDGIPAVALTDKNNLFGALAFSKKASGSGVQPIIGIQLYLEYDEGKYGSFTLLAQNEKGYKNLCGALRYAFEPREVEKGIFVAPKFPNITPDDLTAFSEGLIILTGGGKDGLLPKLVSQNKENATQLVQWLLSVFGDRMYIEVCRNEVPTDEQAVLENAVIDFAYGAAGAVECMDGVERAQIPMVGTTDVWYAEESRHNSWEILKAVSNKAQITIDGNDIVGADKVRYHLRSSGEMKAIFKDLPEAYENAANIARRCHFLVEGRKPILPPFACEGGRTEDEELRHQAEIGLKARLDKQGTPEEDRKQYFERLDYELGVIQNMGFPGYFLIVSDFIKWSKSQDIPVGPGRGSGAGSVVAWSLTITDLDPLEFGLLFERFLNPERVSMPDFDIDFCQDRRDDVIQYVQRKYGKEMVSMIATFGEIKSKTALKDAGRVITHNQLGTYGFGELNSLSKAIPDNPADPKTLKVSYEEAAEFRELIDGSQKMRVLFDYARSIEGLYRNSGQHAAGVLIGDRPLDHLVPVTWDEETQVPVCGFNMKDAEAAGMVKFDFLGLTTLSIIKECERNIRKTRGIDLDISDIPRDDKEVYERFASGLTTGVFQFEGGGMRKVLKSVRPTRLEDLIAVNALYRPGPMDYIPLYAERKNGQTDTKYPHPAEKTKPFLEETYGIMVYQEQVMQVAQACAGYSLGGADLLRRAMGKKIPAEMEKQRKIFIEGEESSNTPGAVALGMDAKAASDLFDDIAMFAGYGFNKSHAAAYAWIGYQTMWLKVHYPVEFFSALMTYNSEKPEKLALIKDELDELGVPLLPPCINNSYPRFVPEETTRGDLGFGVRFGLSAIKTISGDQSALIAARNADGPFTSIEDFHRRAGTCFNKAQVERLAEAGAFDLMVASRRQAASALGWLASKKSKTPTNQTDLFGGDLEVSIPKEVLDVAEWGDVADREFKAVGFYFSSHPIDAYVPRLIAGGVRRKASFQKWMIERGEANLEDRKLCVMIDDVRTKSSKRGTPYIDLQVSERGESFRISCFESWKEGAFTIDEFRQVAEGAKASRTPVVCVASLSLDSSGEGVWVNGRELWAVDEFLAEIRGDFVIRIDENQVRLNKEEGDRLRKINQYLEDGQIPADEAEYAITKLRGEAGRRKSEEIEQILKKMALCEGDSGSSVVIVSGDNEKKLEGTYKFNVQIESVLKTMDGVVSIREEVINKQEQRPNQARAA